MHTTREHTACKLGHSVKWFSSLDWIWSTGVVSARRTCTWFIPEQSCRKQPGPLNSCIICIQLSSDSSQACVLTSSRLVLTFWPLGGHSNMHTHTHARIHTHHFIGSAPGRSRSLLPTGIWVQNTVLCCVPLLVSSRAVAQADYD